MIGRVYKVIHNQSNICYVGSSFNILRQRWQGHKDNYKKYLKGKHAEIAIYRYFEKYGIENFKILKIKEYEVVDKKHLEMYEQLWINKLKPVNKNSPFEILKKQKKKDYDKTYRETNKEHIKQIKKEYSIKNKDTLNEKSKEYYEKNKQLINKIITCECGKTYSKSHKARHERSKKHITALQKK